VCPCPCGDHTPHTPYRWIEWFCLQRGHEFFCEVPREWIEDKFNLYGLRETVTDYDESIDIVLDESEGYSDTERLGWHGLGATTLYGLIHARYIITDAGAGVGGWVGGWVGVNR
jgi:casein kinase II subunit beta